MAESKRSKVFAPTLECIILLMVCWGAAMLGPLSFLLPFLLIYGLGRFIWARNWWSLTILLIANPFIMGLCIGAHSYMQGRPCLVGMGLPGTEYANIERTTRCFRATGGCVIHGNEWVFQLPHNLVVRTLALSLGPPKGSYDGPYPTREDAIKAAADGSPVKPGDFASGRIQVGEKTIQLNSDITEEILMHCIPGFWFPDFGEEDFNGRLSCTLWEGRCLVLRWQGQLDFSEEPGEVLVLIDTESSRPFAIYELIPGSVRGRAVIGRFWR